MEMAAETDDGHGLPLEHLQEAASKAPTRWTIRGIVPRSQAGVCVELHAGLILNKIGERYVSSMSDGLVQDTIEKTRPLLLQFVYDVEHYGQGIPPPAQQKWVVVEEAPRHPRSQAPSQLGNQVSLECPTGAQDAARAKPVDPLGNWRKKIRQITAINAVKAPVHGDGPRDHDGSAIPPPPPADGPPAMPAGMAAPTKWELSRRINRRQSRANMMKVGR